MRHWYGPGTRRASGRGRGRARAPRLATLGQRAAALAAPMAGGLAARLPVRTRGAQSAVSVLVSVGVHAVVLAMLALALRGVAHRTPGTVQSLDLGAGPGEGETFALAPPAVDLGEPAAEEAGEPTRASDPAAAAARLAAAIERVAGAPEPRAEGPSIERGPGADGEDGAGDGAGADAGNGASLLERGPPPAGPLAGLRDGGAAPALDGASFAGVSASRASSVVYAVDASGAMVTSLPFVLEELRRSVSALAGDQRFAVVLFGRRAGDEDAGVRAFPPDGLRRATPASKAELFDWLQGVGARGASNPLDGLLAAIDREPEVVFLLSRSIRRTDGRSGAGPGAGPGGGSGDWGPGREAILAELERANPVRKSIFGPPARPVQVKCVQFLEEDPTGVMRAIAREHGGGPGSYRLLPESELRRR